MKCILNTPGKIYHLFALGVCLISGNSFFSQSRIFNNWYFGQKAGVTFNTNPPQTLIDGKLNTIEGCAAVSDSLGNLLFYTDGSTVWNMNHVPMPGGTGLLGHTSSTNSALIVPIPYNDSLFYIFTTDAQAFQAGGCACLAWSMVNMRLQGGTGAIIASSKNTIIRTPVTEKLIAVSLRDTLTWVLAHDWDSNNFLAYKITTAGLDPLPVISSSGTSHCCSATGTGNTRGAMKVSPDGKKLVACTSSDSLAGLFDFDINTGIVSNPRIIARKPEIYGAEFSLDSRLLYITYGNLYESGLVQLDLSFNDPALIYASSITLDSTDVSQFGQLQLGPDDKIYMSEYESYYLAAINSPNTRGLGCNLNRQQLYLEFAQNGAQALAGLPNRILNYYPAVPDTSKTDTITKYICTGVIIRTNIITPNNDGTNDSLTFLCSDGSRIFPEELSIYNRWGKIVLEQKTKVVPDLSFLSDGVYFYCFRYNDQDYHGYLMVCR